MYSKFRCDDAKGLSILQMNWRSCFVWPSVFSNVRKVTWKYQLATHIIYLKKKKPYLHYKWWNSKWVSSRYFHYSQLHQISKSFKRTCQILCTRARPDLSRALNKLLRGPPTCTVSHANHLPKSDTSAHPLQSFAQLNSLLHLSV